MLTVLEESFIKGVKFAIEGAEDFVNSSLIKRLQKETENKIEKREACKLGTDYGK